MLKISSLILFVAAALTSTGCAFYWDGDAEIRLNSGGTVRCRSLYSDSDGLDCKRGSNITLKYSWEDIAGFSVSNEKRH